MNTIDSDSEEEITPVPEEVLQQRKEKKDAFRAKLLAWKSKRLDAITSSASSQNTTSLIPFFKEAANLYMTIREKLEGRTAVNPPIDFDFNTVSVMERADLLSVAKSDLIEFPFTYKGDLINSFPKTNSLETAEIIPNQE